MSVKSKTGKKRFSPLSTSLLPHTDSFDLYLWTLPNSCRFLAIRKLLWSVFSSINLRTSVKYLFYLSVPISLFPGFCNFSASLLCSARFIVGSSPSCCLVEKLLTNLTLAFLVIIQNLLDFYFTDESCCCLLISTTSVSRNLFKTCYSPKCVTS